MVKIWNGGFHGCLSLMWNYPFPSPCMCNKSTCSTFSTICRSHTLDIFYLLLRSASHFRCILFHSAVHCFSTFYCHIKSIIARVVSIDKVLNFAPWKHPSKISSMLWSNSNLAKLLRKRTEFFNMELSENSFYIQNVALPWKSIEVILMWKDK